MNATLYPITAAVAEARSHETHPCPVKTWQTADAVATELRRSQPVAVADRAYDRATYEEIAPGQIIAEAAGASYRTDRERAYWADVFDRALEAWLLLNPVPARAALRATIMDKIEQVA